MTDQSLCIYKIGEKRLHYLTIPIDAVLLLEKLTTVYSLQ